MTDDKIRALKRELAEAEAKAKTEAKATVFADAKAKLENRAYCFNHDNRSWVAARIVLFGKVKQNQFSEDLESETRSLRVVRYGRPKPGFEIHGCSERCDYGFKSADAALRDSRGEIPKPVFMRMYKEAGNLGDCCMKWLTRVFDDPATEPCTDEDRLGDDEAGLGVDIPYLELDAGDANIMPRRFLLSGRRYVLSPGSIAAGLKKLDGEARGLRQGSHLYQDCDMGYVNSKTAQILRLRQRLTGAE